MPTASRKRPQPPSKLPATTDAWIARLDELEELLVTAVGQNEQLLGQRNALVDEVVRLKRVNELLLDGIQRGRDREFKARQGKAAQP